VIYVPGRGTGYNSVFGQQPSPAFLKTPTTNLLLYLVIATLTVLAWAAFNQPADDDPAWPHVIQGVSFSPLRAEHDPTEGRYPTAEQIDEDLALLAGEVERIRTYTVRADLYQIPRLAKAHDLKVTLGAHLSGEIREDAEELKKLITVAKENWDTVERVIIGNETLLTNTLTVDRLATYLDRVRRSLPMPVSTAEPWHIWLQHPELVQRVDFIAVHLLPYWEGLPADAAVAYLLKRYRELQAAYPDKPIVIGEVGWPSNGRQREGAVPSISNQAMFLKRFLALASNEGWDYFLIEAFDQPWKAETEGGAGAYWGLYDVERNPKFSFTAPVVEIPQWRLLALISVAFAILVLGPLLRGDHSLNSIGRGFLAVVTFAAVTAIVWLIYSYTKQYLTWSSIVLGIVMLLAVLGLIMVLLAEAHEWAEALWAGSRRVFQPPRLRDDELPFVSIHIPAYSEPPEMLKETLDALAAQDYPHFEVVLIDNNTTDPALWQPVRDHCEKLGPRFRFFHYEKLAGFKAGAMNVALRQTDPRAEVIAVIDSDYLVEHDWLRDLAPAFSDPELGIMQAPQDYRDGGENLFKAMCHAEYRGFFQIGMVTRNERNAIIQHGTMTMIRKSVLEEVGGWSEWCITEDAELGLRVFEHGYKAQYVPVSYGRGLIPDNFLDFKKQRFRWAYGAMVIMRRHFAELFGFRPTQLTRGQRYHFIAGWLPWVSDGLSLVINMTALAWTVGMIVLPEHFDPPLMMFALFPLALFAFKLIKLTLLYQLRVRANLRQSIGAAIAGLSLAHGISRAVIQGLTSSNLGFFRTPKMASHSAFLQALNHAREELLLLIALWVGAWGLWVVHGFGMPDIRIWVTMLLVQSIPYGASVVMSLISSRPDLPASLIGTMETLGKPGPGSGNVTPATTRH